MDLQEFLLYMNSEKEVIYGSEIHKYMGKLAQDAIRLTLQINSKYNTQKEINDIFFELTNKCVGKTLHYFHHFTQIVGKI